MQQKLPEGKTPMTSKPCPLCDMEAEVTVFANTDFFECKRCGQFKCSRTLQAVLTEEDCQWLSVFTRNNQDIELTTENKACGVKQIQTLGLQERTNRALINIFEKANRVTGQEMEIHLQNDVALCWATSTTEMGSIVNHLEKRALICHSSDSQNGFIVSVSASGVMEIEDIEAKARESNSRGTLGFGR
jgi:flagellar biosynthesis/type III secretory pathway chaperone